MEFAVFVFISKVSNLKTLNICKTIVIIIRLNNKMIQKPNIHERSSILKDITKIMSVLQNATGCL